jgi:DNA-binding transcriptional LysR family regulator
MDLLNEMAVFAAVVDAGSFSAAARKLDMTTSAVSRHVSRLEASIGGRLLQRTTRSLSLTELGRNAYEGSSRLVNAAREVRALADTYGEKPTGLLHVSAPVVLGQVWLAPKMEAFLAHNPGVSVRMTLLDRELDLVEEGVDVAVRISRALMPGLAARPLFPVRYVLVAAPAYLKLRGQPASPADLGSHSCIHLGYGAYGNEWTLQQGESRETVTVAPRLTATNSAAILAAVDAGAGIGLMPDFTARAALASGAVVQVLPQWTLCEPYTGTAHAVYVPGRHMALKVRALIDFFASGV